MSERAAQSCAQCGGPFVPRDRREAVRRRFCSSRCFGESTRFRAVGYKRTPAPLEACWHGIKQRCFGGSCPSFERYGARGITMHQAWRESFEAFASDVVAEIGRRPSSRHSIDRVDNAGNYEPGNIRWALPIEQSRNRRDNVLITFMGETLCIAEWAERYGLKTGTLWHRLSVAKWPIERALLTRDGRSTRWERAA